MPKTSFRNVFLLVLKQELSKSSKLFIAMKLLFHKHAEAL